MVKFIQPRVIKLAETKVDQNAARLLMEEYGKSALEWLSNHSKDWTSDAEMLIEIAGRVCYRSFGTGLNPNITQIRTESKDYFENVLKKGDGSIFEHGSITFALMWVSRVFTHELVRHRTGTAYSQESLRYVRPEEVQFPEWAAWMPVEIDEQTRKSIVKALEDVERQYVTIQAKLSWDKMNFDQKKRATSALRRLLPQGVATVIIFTANHRTLRWLIEMRTDAAAELEIRKVFGQVAEICIRDYPLIYSDFRATPAPDGIAIYKPTLRSKV